ncbi:uncharacterized protein LOC110931676 [Helianthus annuus]|uniref:uncharacterized protein LOC110931676 n=1 Tax=Helianthus annuus TaxID=4232 RepID=UPI000B908803|nr:uncharacterized protein LOC110931676 [Helianthus annuus]
MVVEAAAVTVLVPIVVSDKVVVGLVVMTVLVVTSVARGTIRVQASSQNDINVLQQSPLFLSERNGTAPKCPFYVNNHLYKRGYYLTDGIYPTWSVFVKSFPYPHIVKEKKFKRQHEAVRKDVERAFGVLKAKWHILHRPMRATNDGNAIAPVHIRDPPVEPVFEDTAYNELIDEDTHYRLKYDLVEHLGEQYLPHLLADSDDE